MHYSERDIPGNDENSVDYDELIDGFDFNDKGEARKASAASLALRSVIRSLNDEIDSLGDSSASKDEEIDWANELESSLDFADEDVAQDGDAAGHDEEEESPIPAKAEPPSEQTEDEQKMLLPENLFYDDAVYREIIGEEPDIEAPIQEYEPAQDTVDKTDNPDDDFSEFLDIDFDFVGDAQENEEDVPDVVPEQSEPSTDEDVRINDETVREDDEEDLDDLADKIERLVELQYGDDEYRAAFGDSENELEEEKEEENPYALPGSESQSESEETTENAFTVVELQIDENKQHMPLEPFVDTEIETVERTADGIELEFDVFDEQGELLPDDAFPYYSEVFKEATSEEAPTPEDRHQTPASEPLNAKAEMLKATESEAEPSKAEGPATPHRPKRPEPSRNDGSDRGTIAIGVLIIIVSLLIATGILSVTFLALERGTAPSGNSNGSVQSVSNEKNLEDWDFKNKNDGTQVKNETLNLYNEDESEELEEEAIAKSEEEVEEPALDPDVIDLASFIDNNVPKLGAFQQLSGKDIDKILYRCNAKWDDDIFQYSCNDGHYYVSLVDATETAMSGLTWKNDNPIGTSEYARAYRIYSDMEILTDVVNRGKILNVEHSAYAPEGEHIILVTRNSDGGRVLMVGTVTDTEQNRFVICNERYLTDGGLEDIVPGSTGLSLDVFWEQIAASGMAQGWNVQSF